MSRRTSPLHVQAPAGEPVLVMTRTFAAPRATVWRTLTEPALVARWYGGHGFENPRCEMDVRPGGRWRHVMRTPDGAEHQLDFTFLEVVAPERLVWRDTNFDSLDGPHSNVMTVTLTEVEGLTLWRLVVRFKSLHDRETAATRGFVEVLGQGCERVEALMASAR